MILPIVAYGDPVLKKRAEDISRDYPELEKLIADMFETMESADGVGLAAPQVGLGIRLFVVDAAPFSEDEELPKDEREFLKGFRRAFINPVIEEEWGDPWGFEEGCLSIPGIHEKVFRPESIRIKYMDSQWNECTEELSGLAARVVQHEYDHLEGTVFTDRLSPLSKRMIQKRLQNISQGHANARYPMRFPHRK